MATDLGFEEREIAFCIRVFLSARERRVGTWVIGSLRGKEKLTSEIVRRVMLKMCSTHNISGQYLFIYLDAYRVRLDGIAKSWNRIAILMN
jgi:hypothetical protein